MHERVAARFERPERAAVERDDIALRRPDGRALWVSVSSTSMPEAGGSAAGLLLMVADITERRRDEERLRFLADHDAVTGLLNRRQLYARLEQARAHHLRHHGTSALVLLDLDDFKLVNDARGHHAGDLVLRSVAGVLTAELRKEDTAARMGGDEFETTAIADLRRATAFAERLAALGCDLALDDFGTGFSAMNHLRDLPVRYLKIDMEFIRPLAHSEIDQRIVRAIVSIAEILGQLTVAEGVEDLETMKLLHVLGVTEAQGYALGLPAPCLP